MSHDKYKVEVGGSTKGRGPTLSEALRDFAQRCIREGESIEQYHRQGVEYRPMLQEAIDHEDIKIKVGTEHEKEVKVRKYTTWEKLRDLIP